MTKLLTLLLFVSCAHQKNKVPEQDHVTVLAALDQAQASYLRGCVDAARDFAQKKSFETCRDRSLVHRAELNKIMSDE